MKMMEVVAEASLFIRLQAGCGLLLAWQKRKHKMIHLLLFRLSYFLLLKITFEFVEPILSHI
jgi:hypothetical protein